MPRLSDPPLPTPGSECGCPTCHPELHPDINPTYRRIEDVNVKGDIL